eukprot:139916_1
MAIDKGIEEVDEHFIYFGYCSLIVFITLFAWILPWYFVLYEILDIQYPLTRTPTKDEINLAHTVNSNSNVPKPKKMRLTICTKTTLLIAVILKFLYLVKNCYITILLFVLVPYYSTLYCRIFYVVNYYT